MGTCSCPLHHIIQKRSAFSCTLNKEKKRTHNGNRNIFLSSAKIFSEYDEHMICGVVTSYWLPVDRAYGLDSFICTEFGHKKTAPPIVRFCLTIGGAVHKAIGLLLFLEIVDNWFYKPTVTMNISRQNDY